MIVTTHYQRKAFRVKAVRVTEENMTEVADWCKGGLRLEPIKLDELRPYVEIITYAGTIRKPVKAYVGDWVTNLSGNNFKVYRDKSFLQTFEEIRAESEKRIEVLTLVELMLGDNIAMFDREPRDLIVSAYVDKMMDIFA